MTAEKTIYQSILEFSNKQTPWKRDALRRLVAHGAATDADLADAITLCKVEHGLTAPGPLQPQPLAAHHLPTGPGTASQPVTLKALANLQNVNALLPDQRLEFASSGLTTIFGYNGAGKSGYARVLKRLCRARGAQEAILTNAFTAATGAPSATVEFRVGATDEVWTGVVADPDAPADLGEICVYDRSSGEALVVARQKVDLLPAGLDLPVKLRDVLDHVANALREDDSNDAQAIGFPQSVPGTAAAAFLAQLDAKTTVTALDAATSWSPEQQRRLTDLRVQLARLKQEDPEVRAKELDRQAERIEKLVAALEKLAKDVGSAIADRTIELRKQLRESQQAQAAIAAAALGGDVLAGTGEVAWRTLWEAARKFATEVAYPASTYPNVEDGARCVLCQQDLDAEAKRRLESFEAFVQGEAAKKVDEAQKAILRGLAHFDGIRLAELEAGGSARVDEATIDPALPATIDAFVATAKARCGAMRSRLELDAATDADLNWPELPVLALNGLRDAAAKLRSDAVALRKTLDPSVQRKLAGELSELEARLQLHDHRPMLDEEVKRLQRSAKRAQAIGDCNPRTVTLLAKNLTNRHVTEALVEAFNRELKRLGAERLQVELRPAQASKGESFTALGLVDTTDPKIGPAGVFSEGERRAVGLAAFFAELAVSQSGSAIVFDDPVTSLDHRWRESVAKRLAEAAKERQVIVFTHDAVFLAFLNSACASANVSHEGKHLQRMGDRPGYCSDDAPWETKKVKARVATLTDRLVKLHASRSATPDDDYAKSVTEFQDSLRKTWERAVEEILFNGVVERFNYGVKTQSLATVNVEQSDYKAIEDGMGRCSAWVHDSAQPLSRPPPEPEELQSMVNDLVDWVEVIGARRPVGSTPKVKRSSVVPRI